MATKRGVKINLDFDAPHPYNVSMVTTQTGFATINGARLYYEVAGTGQPLVMLHSHLVDSGQWDAQFAYFARSRQVIRYDARGFGASDLPPAPFAHHEDLHGLLVHLGITQADLMGCSGGGMTILDFALVHPELVGKLILVATAVSGYHPTTPPPPMMLAMNQARAAHQVEQAVELSLRALTDGPRRSPEQVDATVRERTRRMSTKLFARPPVPEAVPQWLDPPAAARLATISAPMLAIIGAEDQPPLHEITNMVVSHLPNAQKVVIPEAGHHPNMEQPALFNTAVKSFLTS